MLGAQRQALALDGRDPLRPLEIGASVQRHDEHALAQQGLGAGSGEPFRRRRHLGRIEAAEAAQGARGVIVGHHIAHRPVTLGLDDQPTLELQARPHQRRQRTGLAQQSRDRFRIVVGTQDFVDGGAEAHQPPTHGPALDLEGGGEVVGGMGVGQGTARDGMGKGAR